MTPLPVSSQRRDIAILHAIDRARTGRAGREIRRWGRYAVTGRASTAHGPGAAAEIGGPPVTRIGFSTCPLKAGQEMAYLPSQPDATRQPSPEPLRCA